MHEKKRIRIIKRGERGRAPESADTAARELRSADRKKQRDLFSVVSGWVGELKRKKANETRIDFDRPAREVHNHVRGLSPVPGAWFEVDVDGQRERLKVLATTLAGGAGPPGTLLDDRLTIACRSGAVRIGRAQRAGKRPMSADELLRGLPLRPGATVWRQPDGA